MICAAQPGRERVPKEVRQRGETMRRDGEEAAVSGEGDQEGFDSHVGHGGESGGAATKGNDWLGGELMWYISMGVQYNGGVFFFLTGHLWKVGERTEGGQPKCWGTEEELLGTDRAKADPS